RRTGWLASPEDFAIDTIVRRPAGSTDLKLDSLASAPSRTDRGSSSDSTPPLPPQVLSKCTVTSNRKRLSDALPEMCHGVGPDSCPSRCTEARISVPCRRSMPAERSNTNDIGRRPHKASKPSQPCTLKLPVPAVTSARAPNCNGLVVSASEPCPSICPTL